MDKIAVLIPCFNEAATINKVINDWHEALPDAVIYVYDNNSTDGTDVIAQRAGAIVRYEYKQGKGNVVRRMFQDIDAYCYIMIDGDDTYPADDAREMVDLILQKNFDMVVGDRISSTYYKENKRPFHNFGNSITKTFINKMFNSNIQDIMTGCRALSFRFVKTFPVISQGFEVETEMTIHAIDKNMAVANKIIAYRDRPQGSFSKLNTFSDGFKVIKKILHLYCDYKPFYFFSIVAAFLTCLSLGFFIPVFVEYLDKKTVERFPTLITCGFGMLSALVSFFSGVILQTIKHQEQREFEFKLKETNQWQKNR